MSQHKARSSRISGIAALAVCLAGCIGPGVPAPTLDYDPIRGGRPLPAAPASAGSEVALELPPNPASGARSPAALASASRTPNRPTASVKDPLVGVPVAATGKDKATTTASAAVPAGTGESTFEQLQQELRGYGVVWQQLKTGIDPNEWIFACAIPDPQTNGVQRHFEAKAVGPNGLAAIRAVLADIKTDQQQRGER